MVGAPVSYSGNQPQPPPPAGINPAMNPDAAAKYAPPQPRLCSPSAPISTLLGVLPYGGEAPMPYAATAPNYMNPPTSSAPINTSYLYPPNPPTHSPYPAVSSGGAQPPPFPPCSAAPYPPNPAYTPSTNYPPPSSAPPLYQMLTPATYPPAASAPPPFAGAYPPSSGMNQIPAYPSQPPPAGYPAGAGNYAPPGQAPPYGAYSAPPPAGGFYPPPY